MFSEEELNTKIRKIFELIRMLNEKSKAIREVENTLETLLSEIWDGIRILSYITPILEERNNSFTIRSSIATTQIFLEDRYEAYTISLPTDHDSAEMLINQKDDVREAIKIAQKLMPKIKSQAIKEYIQFQIKTLKRFL